jgi:hypothetical protein
MGRLVFLCEKKIRRGGQVFARIKKNKARKVAKPQSLPRRIGVDHNFFASLRLCEKKKEKRNSSQSRQAAKASGG